MPVEMAGIGGGVWMGWGKMADDKVWEHWWRELTDTGGGIAVRI